MVDDKDLLSHVVAANYAFSIGADLQLLPPREDTVRESVYAAIDARATSSGEERGRNAEITLGRLESDLAPVLEFGSREFVTFITNSFPYGYFYQGAPSTHLFCGSLDSIIVNGIFWARYAPAILCAVLIDPGDFDDSETSEISRLLHDWGTVVVELLDSAATVHNVRRHIAGLPHDLLFICSHCGEVSGTREVWRIRDKHGITRVVELDVVAMIASKPLKDGMILLKELFVPRLVDGIDWFSGPGELRAAFWEFVEAKSEPEIERREPVERVAHSTAIQLRDGNLSLLMDIESATSPIVFNNSCVSFFDAAAALMYAGARGYIGTLEPVDNQIAREVALDVIGGSECRVSLPLALYRAQARHPVLHRHIYLHVGCHFNRLRPPEANALDLHRRRIVGALHRWRSYGISATGYGKEYAEEIVEFLTGAISTEGKPNW